MTFKRARIDDSNDPLGLRDITLPTAEPANPSAIPQDNKLKSQQAQEPNSKPKQEEDFFLPTIEEADPITFLTEDPSTEKRTDAVLSPAERESSHHNSTRQPVKKLNSQPDNLQTRQSIELKKATFQIDKAVLDRLEKLVLTLQLELGKENAPYKEVIVEEAIERLLALDKTKLLKVVEKRQARRKP